MLKVCLGERQMPREENQKHQWCWGFTRHYEREADVKTVQKEIGFVLQQIKWILKNLGFSNTSQSLASSLPPGTSSHPFPLIDSHITNCFKGSIQVSVHLYICHCQCQSDFKHHKMYLTYLGTQSSISRLLMTSSWSLLVAVAVQAIQCVSAGIREQTSVRRENEGPKSLLL